MPLAEVHARNQSANSVASPPRHNCWLVWCHRASGDRIIRSSAIGSSFPPELPIARSPPDRPMTTAASVVGCFEKISQKRSLSASDSCGSFGSLKRRWRTCTVLAGSIFLTGCISCREFTRYSWRYWRGEGLPWGCIRLRGGRRRMGGEDGREHG